LHLCEFLLEKIEKELKDDADAHTPREALQEMV
jgi:hypothetical protein